LSTYTGNQQLSERDGAPPPTCGVTIYDDRLYTATDPAGNVIREGELHLDCSATGYSTQTYTNSYYSADNRLAVVQRVPYGNAAGTGSWEEYRYDAMGRRVMTRARRDSALCTQSQSITCVSFVERVVWDGDQILYEQRTSGLDVITGGAPNYGTVGYVHALGIDRPVHLLGDGRVIHYNWRRLGEASSWADGSTDDCQLTTGTCTTIPWPAGEGVYYRRATNPYAGLTITWIGNLPANGANTTGQLYRRNRYYDAASGRFTQEDPIGLAGGLNLYGFAGGDPVNFSDPFGLCPLGNCTQSQRHYEVDAAGDQFIKGSETFKTRPYDDGVGNATIGYGHVIQAGDNFPSGGIDRQEADALYESDKERIVQPGLDKISNPSLNQNQVNALGSYIFNAGPGHFQRRILPSINAGNYKTATDAMVGSTIGRNLTTGETRSLPGLQTRRQAEINLFYKQP
jgi:RHS repeat-associated protein